MIIVTDVEIQFVPLFPDKEISARADVIGNLSGHAAGSEPPTAGTHTGGHLHDPVATISADKGAIPFGSVIAIGIELSPARFLPSHSLENDTGDRLARGYRDPSTVGADPR